MDPKVSIVIPIYNTANYLEEAVKSILHQTLCDIEVILINDGSTDESGDIIKRMAAKYKRVRFFEQSNQGQSVARNVGFQHAEGRYIYFMDSDDILDLEALEILYELAERKQLDFIFFDGDILYETEDSHLSWNYQRTEIYDEKNIYQGISLMRNMLENGTHRAVPWLLFIRNSHLKNIKLSFYPRIIHEDELFTTLLYIQSKRVGCLKKSLVKHRIRKNSIMNNCYSLRNIIGYLTVVDELFAYASHIGNNKVKKLVIQYTHYTLNRVIYTAYTLSFSDKYTSFKWFIKRGYLKYGRVKTWAIYWLKKK